MKFEIRVRTLQLDIYQTGKQWWSKKVVTIVGYTTEDYEVVKQEPEDVIMIYPDKGCVIAEETKYFMVDTPSMEPTLKMMLSIKNS